MKMLKILLGVILGIVVIVVGVAGYYGLVPGVSKVFGADKSRDLGIITSDESASSATAKFVVTKSGDPASAARIAYSGSNTINISLTSEEISSIVAKGKWKLNPISEGFQVKINKDNTVEVAGILNRVRLNGYLQTTGFTEVLTYTEKFNFLPEKVPFYLNGSLSIKNNKIDLNLTSAEIGKVPLPTDSKSVGAAENFVERRMSAVTGLNVTSLDFSGGKLNFKGTYPAKISF